MEQVESSYENQMADVQGIKEDQNEEHDRYACIEA